MKLFLKQNYVERLFSFRGILALVLDRSRLITPFFVTFYAMEAWYKVELKTTIRRCTIGLIQNVGSCCKMTEADCNKNIRMNIIQIQFLLQESYYSCRYIVTKDLNQSLCRTKKYATSRNFVAKCSVLSRFACNKFLWNIFANNISTNKVVKSPLPGDFVEKQEGCQRS